MSFGRLGRRAGPQPMNEINMTPLIDVMLVLLVIFMVTAPLMSSSLKLDLPRTDAATPSETPRPLMVGLDAQGRLFVGNERVDRPELMARAAAAAEADPRTEVQLRADRSVPDTSGPAAGPAESRPHSRSSVRPVARSRSRHDSRARRSSGT